MAVASKTPRVGKMKADKTDFKAVHASLKRILQKVPTRPSSLSPAPCDWGRTWV